MLSSEPVNIRLSRILVNDMEIIRLLFDQGGHRSTDPPGSSDAILDASSLYCTFCVSFMKGQVPAGLMAGFWRH